LRHHLADLCDNQGVVVRECVGAAFPHLYHALL